jgi:predicted  nucleic acid-binding Zn-ribbon protein
MSPSKSNIKVGIDSHCLICGRDFYDLMLDTCPRCGGRCNHYDEKDMFLMERRQTRGAIKLSPDIEG